jgi:hypothetical protein
MYLRDVLEQLKKLNFNVDNDKCISLAIHCNGLYTGIPSITCENAKTLFGKFIVTESGVTTSSYNDRIFRFVITPESLTSC